MSSIQCRYGGCSCNISVELDKRRKKELLHQFLMGLDDSIYGTVRSNILSTRPLPNLNWAYAMVVQERVHNIARGKEIRNEPMAFVVQMKSILKGRTDINDKSIMCTNCKRTGHEAGKCFQLIGYP